LLGNNIDLDTSEEVCKAVYKSICAACDKESVIEIFDALKASHIATYQRGELTTELVRLVQLKDARLSNIKMELTALTKPREAAPVQQPVATTPSPPRVLEIDQNVEHVKVEVPTEVQQESPPVAEEVGIPAAEPPIAAPAGPHVSVAAAENISQDACIAAAGPHIEVAAELGSSASLKPDGKEDDDKARRARSQPLLKVLKLIHQHKDAAFFRNPVTVDEAPNYYKVIKQPMDLTSLRVLLDNGDVNNAEELWENLLLIFNNAFSFNSKNSTVFYKASKLKEFAQKEMESVLEVEKMIVANPNAGSTRRAKRAPEAAKAMTPAAPSAVAAQQVVSATAGRVRKEASMDDEDQILEEASARKGNKRVRGKNESGEDEVEEDEEEEEGSSAKRSRRRATPTPRVSGRVTRDRKDKEDDPSSMRGRGNRGRGRKK